MGGVGRKHTGEASDRGHRLHRRVRLKWLHVAVATVTARAQDVEMAETLMGFTKSTEVGYGHRRGGTRCHPSGRMSVIFRVRRLFQSNEKKFSQRWERAWPRSGGLKVALWIVSRRGTVGCNAWLG